MSINNKLGFKVALLVFLIALLSYGIGYLMGKNTNQTPIVIEKISQ